MAEFQEVLGIQGYEEYSQNNTFSQDFGLVVLPVAGQVSAHRVIRLHGGFGIRIAKWHASRIGKPPVIPSAGNTADDTILSATIAPSLPVPNSTGVYDWIVNGEYAYVQNMVRTPGLSAFPVGDFPFRVEPTMSRADELGGPTATIVVGGQYPSAFQELVKRLQVLPGTRRGEDFFWPFLALPSVASTDNLI